MSATRFGRAGAGRTALLLGSVAAVVTILIATEPGIRAEESRLADARAMLRSDEVAFASEPHLRQERERLQQRFEHDLATDPQAVVLHALAATLRRYHVTFASSESAAIVPFKGAGNPAQAEFEDVRLDLDLRGTYRGVLLAIDDLPRACDLARVESASLHRNGNSLAARVSIALLRPVRVR